MKDRRRTAGRACRSGLVLLLTLAMVAGGRAGEVEEDPFATRLEAVDKLIRSRNYDSALTLVDALLEDAPGHAEALYRRAYLLEKVDRVPEATDAYYACIDELVDRREAGDEDEKLLERCRKAVLRLDESRQIVLEHAEEIEREAKRFKGKNDYAYERLLETAALIRGAWERKKAAKKESPLSSKDARERIEERYLAFHRALVDGEIEEARTFVDPEIRHHAGDARVDAHLRALRKWAKMFKVGGRDVSLAEVTLARDGRAARIVPRFPVFGRRKNGDPQYWVLRDGEWYLGDDKHLQDFEAADD